ncbi:hypothetical protein [Thermoactinomyces sp. DSM 45892]|uniref:hypothetical protein n=1 Tax=Thermoactinomyces sp. DSM 45892 TaxID=1882753 RepID=UPI0008956C58|nr:hypothetical protein [Thermoactinomyces sp. DSM 45892]SDY85401.1 hypothetical protein SAMN05444416_10980 [Thermoactinomyces sp. DSM 45892]
MIDPITMIKHKGIIHEAYSEFIKLIQTKDLDRNQMNKEKIEKAIKKAKNRFLTNEQNAIVEGFFDTYVGTCLSMGREFGDQMVQALFDPSEASAPDQLVEEEEEIVVPEEYIQCLKAVFDENQYNFPPLVLVAEMQNDPILLGKIMSIIHNKAEEMRISGILEWLSTEDGQLIDGERLERLFEAVDNINPDDSGRLLHMYIHLTSERKKELLEYADSLTFDTVSELVRDQLDSTKKQHKELSFTWSILDKKEKASTIQSYTEQLKAISFFEQEVEVYKQKLVLPERLEKVREVEKDINALHTLTNEILSLSKNNKQ